jgi:putative pyruvate formate lyase activating enzyme
MPNRVGGTREIATFLAEEISPHTYVNVMDQYRPCGSAHRDPMINRRLSAEEFREAMTEARGAGLIRLDPRDHIRLRFL